MKLSAEDALKQGIEAHQAGRIQEADKYYTAILQAAPKHPDANHNMGVLAVGVGKVQEALPFLKTALEANLDVSRFRAAPGSHLSCYTFKSQGAFPA